MNTTESDWLVQIQGSTSDLEHLARYFNAPPKRVFKDTRDAGFLYQSVSFAACSTSAEVLALADQEFAVLSGVLRFTRESREPLRSGAVYRQNSSGGRDVFVHIRERLQLRMELGEVTVTVTDRDGNVLTRPTPPPRTVLLAQLAESDAAVAKALRLNAEEDAKSWVGLYRIYEVVEADVGGQDALKKRGWGSAHDLRRFKHSANSVTVAGDSARHGKESEQPPKDPMTPDEAAAFVGCLIQSWLASKGA